MYSCPIFEARKAALSLGRACVSLANQTTDFSGDTILPPTSLSPEGCFKPRQEFLGMANPLLQRKRPELEGVGPFLRHCWLGSAAAPSTSLSGQASQVLHSDGLHAAASSPPSRCRSSVFTQVAFAETSHLQPAGAVRGALSYWALLGQVVRTRAGFPSGRNLRARWLLQPGFEGGLFPKGQGDSRFLSFLSKCRRPS